MCARLIYQWLVNTVVNLPIVRTFALPIVVDMQLQDMEKDGLLRLVRDRNNIVTGAVFTSKLRDMIAKNQVPEQYKGMVRVIEKM